MTMLYANDSFLKIKQSLTEEMIHNQNIANLIKEQKTLICDVDRQLEDLQKWREEREN
jgi:hypothetical protein